MHGIVETLRDLCLGAGDARLQLPLHAFNIADDDGQQIVEIVRDSAGEMTDGIEFLRLAQRLFGN